MRLNNRLFIIYLVVKSVLGICRSLVIYQELNLTLISTKVTEQITEKLQKNSKIK